MKNTMKLVVVVSAIIGVQQVAMASGWIRGLDITSLGENNLGGEVVQFTVRPSSLTNYIPNSTRSAPRNPASTSPQDFWHSTRCWRNSA